MKAAAILACVLLGAGGVCGDAAADDSAERWHGPFGGQFNAQFTVASDYANSGISNSQLQPVFQMGLDYKTPDLIDAFPLYLYATGFGSNISFPATGTGVEMDAGGGLKVKLLDRKLAFDLGYVRTSYPGVPASFAYDYGEIGLNVGYDFGVAELNGRLRFSPDAFGNSGNSWNKRALLSVPLDFLKSDTFSFRTYGSLGNFWVERFQSYGLPSQDYWYWQIGLVISAWGLDATVAYTDTSIEPTGCGNTHNCAPRAFVSVTKTF